MRLPVRSLWLSFLTPALLMAPVLAHNVQMSGNVAATFHIEPNHQPKAGQRSLAWFALTRRGGQIVPLSQCNCQLRVYRQPRRSSPQPVLQPPLKAVNMERYRDIPGAEITFPRSGTYELDLTGSPKAGAQFQPFRFTYPVTVGS